jgi:hypothetical protein
MRIGNPRHAQRYDGRAAGGRAGPIKSRRQHLAAVRRVHMEGGRLELYGGGHFPFDGRERAEWRRARIVVESAARRGRTLSALVIAEAHFLLAAKMCSMFFLS